MLYGVKVYNYRNVLIDESIMFSFYNALQLYDCGYSKNATKLYNNAFSGCANSGVICYNTIAEFTMNWFIENRTGIRLLNESSAAVYGDESACSPSETQHFLDNSYHGIYVSNSNFHHLHYNAFEDPPSIDYDYITVEGNFPPESFNVKNNYWGTDFKPEFQLAPYLAFVYEPQWYLCDNSPPADDDPKLLYDSSSESMIAGNYSEAETGFKEVVAQFPQSEYSPAALKKLLALVQYQGGDYQSLKSFLLSDNIIIDSENLKKSAEKIANQCDIFSENWEEAIGWLESVIQEPDCFEDSLYAIIDLGNTYLLMQDGGNKSSSYIGKFPEFKPETAMKHFETTQELLSLIPRDNSSQELKQNLSSFDSGELLQNFPNPFKGSTQFRYKLENESIVQLNVYNYTGQLISTINEGGKTKGTHHIDFDANGLKNGIYFYSISVNGQTTNSKKMTIIK